MIRRAAPLAALLLTAACAAGPGDGPSLLPRAAEKQSFDEPAAPPAPVATPDASLDRKIADLIAERSRASAEFAAADKRVAAQLAAGAKAAPGSDAWLDAQTALGALDAERATIQSVLTDLEQLAIERAGAGQPPYPALEAARVDTDAEADRVSAIVATRKAQLPL